MEKIIKYALDLWDPYQIYSFPDDEYVSYVKQISEFIKNKESLNITNISKFVYNLIPPVEPSQIESINMIEYERFARLILEILIVAENKTFTTI